MKTCEWCERSLPLSEYWRQVDSADKRQGVCKACHTARGGVRREHLTPGPPRRRRSPYENMRSVLGEIEGALARQDAVAAQAAILRAREVYAL